MTTSVGPVMWVMLPEIFPNKVRGVAMAMTGVVNSGVSFGVQFAFMTEDLYGETRMLKQSAGVAVAYGLSWQSALDAITRNAAEIWGIDDQGVIDEGMSATLVVWDGDPLEVTSHATLVVVDGDVIEKNNRQDLLRDRYRNLPGH